ncbi:MAG: DsrE/DsrF/DrsH-like family protein, partial [Candidatus Thiodiazotropha sp.]
MSVDNEIVEPIRTYVPESKIMKENLEELDNWFESRYAAAKAKEEDSHVPSMSIIATKGTLDWAYPPFILASTGAALGWDVSIFFTFYGLELLKEEPDLKVSPLGNP